MKFERKQSRIIVFGLLFLGVLALLICWPAPPKLIVPLADGTQFVLTGTDYGQQLFYGGKGWQAIACKIVRHHLPSFIHDQPEICPSLYSNGIALFFQRARANKSALRQTWNGSGQLYFLDESGGEHLVHYHGVGFNVETRQGQDLVTSEDISWELPALPDPEVRLRLRETNSATGAVSTHNFTIKNPAL